MNGNLLDCLGKEFANASAAQKVVMIDQAIGRVALISQESDTAGNKNRRADLEALQKLRIFYQEQAYYANQPSQFFMAVFGRGGGRTPGPL
jgi:hypothetical protein